MYVRDLIPHVGQSLNILKLYHSHGGFMATSLYFMQQTGKHQVQEELKAVRIQIGTRREPNQSSYESHDQCIEVTEQLSESIEV